MSMFLSVSLTSKGASVCNKLRCENIGNDGFRCICPAGYSGERCEEGLLLTKGPWVLNDLMSKHELWYNSNFFPAWIGCIKYFLTGLHQLVCAKDRNLLFDSLDEENGFSPPPPPPCFLVCKWHLPSLPHIYSSSFYKFAIYLQGSCWCKFIFLPSDLYVKSAGSREEGARGW